MAAECGWSWSPLIDSHAQRLAGCVPPLPLASCQEILCWLQDHSSRVGFAHGWPSPWLLQLKSLGSRRWGRFSTRTLGKLLPVHIDNILGKTNKHPNLSHYPIEAFGWLVPCICAHHKNSTVIVAFLPPVGRILHRPLLFRTSSQGPSLVSSTPDFSYSKSLRVIGKKVV